MGKKEIEPNRYPRPVSERSGHIKWMIDEVEASLYKVDPRMLVYRAIDEIRSQKRKSGAKANFSVQGEKARSILLDGARHYAERVHTSLIINALDWASIENRNFCLSLTDTEAEDVILRDVEEVFVDPNEQIRAAVKAGKQKGTLNILNLLEGKVPLLYYSQDLLENMDLDHVSDTQGQRFRLPTAVPGIRVDYFYPDSTNNRTNPSISLLMDRL